MDDQPSQNAIHEAGHALVALGLGVRSLIVTAEAGGDHRGQWAGRVQYDPAEFDALDPHQRRMVGVAGSIAGMVARGVTPTFQTVINGMSDRDLELCRACGTDAFQQAVDDVVALLQNPEVWPFVLNMASRLDQGGGLISGKFEEMLDALNEHPQEEVF